MEHFGDLLKALGPTGVLVAGFVGVVGWVANMSSAAARRYQHFNDRLDNLDHHEKGRVPIVERRVDDHDEELADIKTDLAVIRTDTQWIRKALGDEPADTPSRERKRKGAA